MPVPRLGDEAAGCTAIGDVEETRAQLAEVGTVEAAPLTNEASSEARKHTTFAISDGSASRGSGVRCSPASSRRACSGSGDASNAAWIIPVSTTPGQ